MLDKNSPDWYLIDGFVHKIIGEKVGDEWIFTEFPENYLYKLETRREVTFVLGRLEKYFDAITDNSTRFYSNFPPPMPTGKMEVVGWALSSIKHDLLKKKFRFPENEHQVIEMFKKYRDATELIYVCADVGFQNIEEKFEAFTRHRESEFSRVMESEMFGIIRIFLDVERKILEQLNIMAECNFSGEKSKTAIEAINYIKDKYIGVGDPPAVKDGHMSKEQGKALNRTFVRDSVISRVNKMLRDFRIDPKIRVAAAVYVGSQKLYKHQEACNFLLTEPEIIGTEFEPIVKKSLSQYSLA